MAVAVQSKTDPSFVTATSVTVTKPSGVVLGDLLVAQWLSVLGASRTLPSGWKTLATVQSNSFEEVIAYKIATSTEVAASDFTFTQNSSSKQACGMLRIDGFSSASPITFYDTEGTNTATNPTFTTTTITPYADSLIIMAIGASDASTNPSAFSGYAIATSSPTFTEAWDVAENTGTRTGIALAYGTRAAATATGAASITYTPNGGRTACVLMSVNPSKDITISESLTLTENYKLDMSIVVNESLTLTEDVSFDNERTWTDRTKPSTVWVNRDR